VKPLRIAVVGAGYMGRLHLSKAAELSGGDAGIELVAAVEVDAARRDAAWRDFSVPVFDDPARLEGVADAAIVAVPTVAHHGVAGLLLRAGLDLLVEKPLAADLDEAEGLLELARSLGRVLQVGHLERFNPALQAVASHTDRPLFVEAHRLGPFPERATDVDVVRDLMIHDLDLIQRLVGEEPERIEAVGVPVLTDKVDIANARVVFPGGCVANVTASRVSPTPMRKLRFFQADGYFSIDLLDHAVAIFRRHPQADGAPRIEMEKLEFDPDDALLAQLRSFAAAVRSREDPVVSARDALAALRTALRVVDAMPDVPDLQ
jgi:predicted dehydrogenase